jgi:Dolichyl-phosphate-mannose-protein mannosyltransferase
MTYNGDIWRQSDTATIARNFASGGMRLFYPQINWGGAGPGYVEAEFQLVPWLAAALYLVFGEHAYLVRLVSLAFMLAGTAAFWALARRLLSPEAARWALISFVASPAFMTYGSAFMPDATALAFYLLALLAFWHWLAEDRWTWLAAAAAATSIAALVKPTTLHIGVVFFIWLLMSARDRLLRPSVYLAGLAALVAPVLWLWHGATFHLTYGNTFGVISGGDSKFGNLSYWLSLAFYRGNLRIEAVLVFGVVGVPLAVLGALGAWRRRGPVILAAGIPALVIYYFATARYSEGFGLGPHYHIYSLPYAAILVGIGMEAASKWLRGRVPSRVCGVTAVAAAIALSTLSVGVFAQSLRDQSGVYRRCSDALRQVSAPNDLVAVTSTFPSVDAGVANNWQDPVIFYMADRRGWSIATDQLDPSFLVADIKMGAKFFVVHEPSLISAGGPLAAWLTTNATQLRSSAVDGCGVWALNHGGVT